MLTWSLVYSHRISHRQTEFWFYRTGVSILIIIPDRNSWIQSEEVNLEELSVFTEDIAKNIIRNSENISSGACGKKDNEIPDELAKKGSSIPGKENLNMLERSVKRLMRVFKRRIDKQILLKWNRIWRSCAFLFWCWSQKVILQCNKKFSRLSD